MEYVLGIIPKHMEVVLRILRPESHLELTKLDAAHPITNVDRTRVELNPVFLTAAQLGVEFEIHTLREAADLRKSGNAPAAKARRRSHVALTNDRPRTAPSVEAGGFFVSSKEIHHSQTHVQARQAHPTP